MNVGWQDAVTLALVAAAVIYTIRRLRDLRRGGPPTGCGDCADRPEASARNRLVPLDPPEKAR
jgi:hypothetical protein